MERALYAGVQQVFGPLPVAQAERTAREIDRLLRRHARLAALRHAGETRLDQLLSLESFVPPAELLTPGAPAIVATCHVGYWSALPLVLRRLGRTALLLRRRPDGPPRPGFEEVYAGEAPQTRAHAMKRAVEVLAEGGLVALAIDLPGELPVTVLGRRMTLARGPFALSRIARAPILPLACELVAPEERIVVHASPELPAGATEADQAARAAAWWDACLRRWPEQIEPATIGRFTSAARVGGWDA